MQTRRDFVGKLAGAGALAALGGGCRVFAGADDSPAVSPPYEDVIRDRLWMWGHGGAAFDKPRHTAGIPPAEPIEMNDACRYLGIPNVCVCRYANLPKAEDCAAYLKTFKDIKRIAFSVVDGAEGSWRSKYELAKALRKDNPNLTTVWLDDFFTPQSLSRPEDLVEFRRTLDNDGFKLASVLYPDQEGIKPEFKDMLSLCDQISVWFWYARNIPGMKDDIRKVRDLVGPEKALIMGVYMWDFGSGSPVPEHLMRRQLEIGGELMAERRLSGLVFHPTSLVSRKLASVEISRRWIAENGMRRI
ncbi:MAG: hypothetical protein IKC80_10290 [Kiritimatiellae bacterium]|nr:hypothetical protein [Kiritimatiellia bacterium]